MLVELTKIKETPILHIKLEQFYDVEQGKDFIQKIRETLNKSDRTNLIIGVDLTEVKVFSSEILELFEICQKLFIDNNVKKMGTLLNSSLVEMQLRRTAKQNYPEDIKNSVKRFQDREEWETYLSEK